MKPFALAQSRTRLPRYRRVSAAAHLALTSRDRAILATVHHYRLVTSEHLTALTDGSNQGILRRLQKLFHAGLLDRVARPVRPTEGNAPMVYAITNRGVRELQKEGLVHSVTKTDWNAQNRDLHGYAIEHTLLISQVRAVLDRACRVTPEIALLTWQEGPKTFDAVEVALNAGYERVPVAPDAYFGLEDPKGRMYFFLEADRGTMTVPRVLRKFAAYAAYWRERRHEQKFGIRYFRVLTVTTGRKRRDHLLAAARNADCLLGLGRLFLITEEAHLRLDHPTAIFGRIWTTPADDDLHALFDEGPSQDRKGDDTQWTTPS
jgi:hypothetical protein